ncbi:energy-coupling factor ABC transporter ATP-binding protein [Halanaeroarchaeum sulfurireducens]|uniref:Cobalt ABC transporter ATP-binding protein n=1 Tax=Halanaeroarchaeum sulfurireducens TaxID=1604004 RepID=A0A0F7PAD6_9EURY|nr:ABC transporter ATP-binding protein [Halanaeroarchaeum sulfurireducens]AKH96604.1 cobalt ABC transporter ATP-binding protein [Halanaeroarchaeum sulfurireducens]ALG81006.1 cobalt ABC transporter ATP-binding protein [Halanaeroarchaeum sulfurireducens]
MIEVRDLVARRGDVTVLDGLSLTVRDGEFLVLTGPNGSGKTTLVRHWNALASPDAGSVVVDGTEATADPVAARTAIGMVFQNPRDQFVAGTVGADVAFGPENLGLAREEIDDRVAEALAAVGMAERREERIDALSGGEQARVAIAGALAMRTSHLVLDEPMTGLDAAGRRSVWDHLDALHAAGTSVVIVTHDLRDVWDRADRIVALADGLVATNGPPAAVADDLPGVRPPC